jgi:hypothetical protein
MASARSRRELTLEPDVTDGLLGRLTSSEWDLLVDRIVDTLEERILGELERRGGRFAEQF